MFEYRQAIVQMRLGVSDRALARNGVLSRTKAKEIRAMAQEAGWLNQQIPLPGTDVIQQVLQRSFAKDRRALSQCEPYRREITDWVAQGVQARTIHRALVERYQFRGAYNCVQRFVKSIKVVTPRASTPLDFKPGEAVQVDFGEGSKIYNPYTKTLERSWFFVMVLCWSRHQYVELVHDQKTETWLKCHRHAFEFFGGVPKKIIIDNARCAITRACYYDPEVQRSYAEFSEHYGFIISPCPPRNPEKKGRVEAGVKYVKRNFLPLREFRDRTDANQQLTAWVLGEAGNRVHGTTRQKPLTVFEEVEKSLLSPLPKITPELSKWKRVKVHGDCHVQFERCYYSAPYPLVKQHLWLRATESVVHIYDQDHHAVATHPRLIKPGSRHTIPDHLPPNGKAYLMQDPQWCLEKASKIGEYCSNLVKELFADNVLDNLRAAQGILKLGEKYGAKRLNAACFRALVFGAIRYRSVKKILENGLEYCAVEDERAFDELSDIYRGHSKYCRNPKNLLQ